MVELSSIIDGNQNVVYSYHDMRLIRAALELINSVYEKDDYTGTVTITERPIG